MTAVSPGRYETPQWAVWAFIVAVVTAPPAYGYEYGGVPLAVLATVVAYTTYAVAVKKWLS